MKFKNLLEIKENYKKVHFIGVLGISMSALAEYLAKFGFEVSGSDNGSNSEIEKKLISKNVRIYKNHNKKIIKKVDVLVYTSAINSDNEELIEAKRLNKVILKRAELLNLILKTFKNQIGVSGCHGKTTTTALITHVLNISKLNPTSFIGGDDVNYSNCLLGGKEYSVCECCEYQKNLELLNVNYPIVLNIDTDHLESYNGFDDLLNTYKKFINGKINFLNYDDKNCLKIKNEKSITFGLKKGAKYYGCKLKNKRKCYTFTVKKDGVKLFKIALKIKGKYNVYNALAVIAVLKELNVEDEKIIKGIEAFSGVKRRNEFLGKLNHKLCFADYAHHYTEIKAYIKTIKNKNALIVFQPHTYSRTKNLMNEFTNVLKNIKNLIIYKTYPARESYDDLGSAKRLHSNIQITNKKAQYIDNESELKKEIFTRKNIKEIYFLGAGDIYEIAKKLITE